MKITAVLKPKFLKCIFEQISLCDSNLLVNRILTSIWHLTDS